MMSSLITENTKSAKYIKKPMAFGESFFFIDIRKMVSRWHYVLFIVNFVAFVLMLILVNIYVLSEENVSRWLFLICGGVYFLSSVPVVFARWGFTEGTLSEVAKSTGRIIGSDYIS